MRISKFDFRGRANQGGSSLKLHKTALAETPRSDTSPMPLDVTDFAAVVSATPLIAIDLIVRDGMGNALFGLRRNPPAQGSWFVPGGRIYKNEKLDDAFCRIAHSELGIELHRNESRLIGVFEHFYETNFLGEPGTDTHYIVLAHVVDAPRSINPPLRQHSMYAWQREADVNRHPDIHPYAKAYFPYE